MDQRTPPVRSGTRVYDGVQCLRFVAALLVVLTHATFYAAERLGGGGISVFERGVDGVDLFFVISGFVMYVSSAQLAERRDGWLEFVVRRLIRIVPLYWLLTTLKVLVMLASPKVVLHAHLDWIYILKSYLLLPALAADGSVAPLLGVGWTLIFEMFFYALFALALLLRIRLVPFLSVTILACLAVSFVANDSWPVSTIYLRNARVSEFLLGVFIARWGAGRPVPLAFAAATTLAGALGLAFLPPYWDHANTAITIATVALPAAMVVYGLVALEPYVAGRWPRWLVYAGGASYSLYLVHGLIAPAAPQLMGKLGLHMPAASVLGSMVISLAGMMVVYTLFERPVTRRLTRWAKRTLPNMTPPLPVSAA